MRPNTPSVIARQRYRELLAEANARRPRGLIRGTASARSAGTILRRPRSTVSVAAVTVLTVAAGVTIGACVPTQRSLHGGRTTTAAASAVAVPTQTATQGRVLASSCLIGTWRVVSDVVTSLPNVQLESGSELRRFNRNGIYTVIDSDATFAFLGTTGLWNATMTWRFQVQGQQLRFTYVGGQGTDFAEGAHYPLWFGSYSTLGFTCSGDALRLQRSGWGEELTRS